MPTKPNIEIDDMNERRTVESFEKGLIGGEMGEHGNGGNCRESFVGFNGVDDLRPGGREAIWGVG